jgi:signal transduction histidine kinase
VQAGAGLDLFDRDPEQARRSLTAIRTVAKEALDELGTVLGTLRRDGDEAPHTPAPGIGQLPDLIAASRAAGLAVRMQTDGAPVTLPSALDLAAYRIVQESLTNIARHAGPSATATIRLSYQADRLQLRVHDDGPVGTLTGADLTSSGTGIAGMRERAAALGGLLTAGPDPAGGFTVAAELPMDGST